MARDPKKYVYFTIGVLRNGETHQAIKADAEEHNTKQLPTVATFRLGEFYRLKNSGLLYAASAGHPEHTQESAVPELSNIDAADEAWPE